MKTLKKIIYLLFVGVVALVTTPNLLRPQALLSEPSTYHYKYKAREISGYMTYVFETPGGYGYEPRYTRTADSTYYNYTTTINNFAYTPFPITLTFNRSNTPWYDTGSGYVPYDTAYIGSDNTVGSITKNTIEFDNNTNKNYIIYLDRSTTAYNFVHWVEYNNIRVLNYVDFDRLIINSADIFLPAYTKLKILTPPQSNYYYFDAFYLEDLGVSSAYTNGQDAGYDNGYEIGYDDAYEDATQDYHTGVNNLVDLYPYDTSWPYDLGYEVRSIEYDEMNGINTGLFNLLSGAFTVPLSILSIELLPSVTLGGLLLIPVIFGLIFMIWKWLV